MWRRTCGDRTWLCLGERCWRGYEAIASSVQRRDKIMALMGMRRGTGEQDVGGRLDEFELAKTARSRVRFGGWRYVGVISGAYFR